MLNTSITMKGALFQSNQIGKILINEALKETANWTVNRLRNISPVRTGALRAGWYSKPIVNHTISIDTPVKYTPYVDARLNMTGKTTPQAEQRLKSNISKAINNIK